MSPKSGKCPNPATAMVKVGDKDWTPGCDDHLADAREVSAGAGKVPPPKGAKGAALAAHSFANRDDVMPIQVRAFTSVERLMDPPCLLASTGE